MSFIQGGTLQAYLDAVPGKKLSVPEVVRIGIELCSALDYLHTHQPQIIFRDLKPLNIMITPQGQIYLIDFGIARHFKQEQAKDTMYYYSVGYSPREQYGQSQTGPRSDIYSLGATLYQMLTGHNPASKPFHFPSLQLLDPTIPVPLPKLIAQMVELDEQQRPASVALVKEELGKVLKPGQIEEFRKVDDGEKERKARAGKVSPKQKTTVDGAQPRPNTWERINLFLGKERMIAWGGFMVLMVALGVGNGQFIRVYSGTIYSLSGTIRNIESYTSYPSDYDTLNNYINFIHRYSNFFWFDVVGIGAALIGLAFLRANGRVIVDIIGGIAFTLLSNILLFQETDFFRYFSYLFSDDRPLLFAFLGASISAFLLLLLGARFFARSANALLGSVVGALMIIAGIVFLILRWNDASLHLHLPASWLWILPILLWILPILLGIVVVIVALRKEWLNRQRRQTYAS